MIEFLDRLIPGNDGEVAKQIERILARQGLKFRLSTKVTAARPAMTGVKLTVEPAGGGPAEKVKADMVLLAIGRRAYRGAWAGGGRRRAG